MGTSIAIPPACYRSLSGPSGPKCPRTVPENVPENAGCSRECPTGCPQGPSGPGLWECPESVPRVSPECQKGVPDFLDTPEPGVRRAPETTRRTLPRTPPIFGDTLGDTPGTLRARRARETPVAGRRDRNTSTTFFMIWNNGAFSLKTWRNITMCNVSNV